MSKNATGGRRGRQSNSSPPITDSKPLPNAPEHMGDIAREMWKHIQDNLPWVGATDYYLVQNACNTYETIETIRHKFDSGQQKMTLTIRNQGKRIHPEMNLLKELQAQLTALMRELGMTPQARRDLDIKKVEEVSPLDAYASRRAQRFVKREEDK